MKRINYLVVIAMFSGITLTSCSKNGYFLFEFETNYEGFIIHPQWILEGERVIKPQDPSRIEYRLAAWYKEVELINEWDFSADVFNTNTKLYAKWEFVLENFNYTMEQSKLLLLGQEIPHYTLGGLYIVIISDEDLQRCTSELMITPPRIGEGIKYEPRVAWQIRFDAPVYYIFTIDVMTGELIESRSTIVS